MPLRGLMYFGRLYSGYIEQNKLNLYRKTLIKIPTPKYVVLYNGTEEQPANMELKLSDAFLQGCAVLGDHMTLVNRIRENREQGMAAEAAIDHAVQYCIEEMLWKTFC